jgi:glycerol-3-phosphate acyltransferase PlsY
MTLWLALFFAYLIGAIPTSYLAARIGAGIDLREHGSKNLGATNLYRVLGGKYAYPVGLFDVLKGTAPVLWLSPQVTIDPLAASWVALIIGAAAIIGHVFPVYLSFKGGKGVATAAGVMIGVAPLPFLVTITVWGTLLASTRIMSLASITGAVVFPVAARLILPGNEPVLWMGAVIAAFIVFTHRANVQRLFAGTEPRLGKPKPSAGEA